MSASEFAGPRGVRGRTSVFGANGCLIPVDPQLFRSVEPVVRAIDAAVPEHLRYAPSALR